MPLVSDIPDSLLLERTRSAHHDTCLLCGAKNPAGLKLKFMPSADGGVSSQFRCGFLFEGYKGMLHGGVAAALIDSAMTNCLFARGVVAVTAELNISYKKPVRCGRVALVKAWLEKNYPPLYQLRAEIDVDGVTAVTATAKFMESAAVSGISAV